MTAPLSCDCPVCRRLRAFIDPNRMGGSGIENTGYSAHFTIRKHLISGPCEAIASRPDSGKDGSSVSDIKGDARMRGAYDKHSQFSDADSCRLHITDELVWTGDGREI